MKRVLSWLENKSNDTALIIGDTALSYRELGQQVYAPQQSPFKKILTYLNHIISNQTTPIALTLSTSGTTGIPKQIPITFKALEHQLTHWQQIIPPKTLEKTLLLTSLNYDLSFIELLYPLSQGKTVIIYPDTKKDPKKIIELINRHRITCAQWNPTLMSMMTSLNLSMPSLSTLILAGEPLKPAILHKLKSQNPHLRILNGYGPTECGYVTFYDVTSVIDNVTNVTQNITNVIYCPIGKPYGDTKLTIIDHQLHVKSPQTISPEEWVNTGDCVTLDADGNYHFLGRKDSQVKWNGYRIECDEITHHLLRHPAIQNAKTYLDSTKNHLISEITPSTPLSKDDVVRHLRTSLEEWKIPIEIIGTTDPTPTRPPSLMTLLADHLNQNINDIDTQKTFFQLGGDSIQGIKLIKAAQESGFQLTFKDLLNPLRKIANLSKKSIIQES